MNPSPSVPARTALKYLRTFFKWLVIAAVLGAVCGLVGGAFHTAVGAATAFRTAHSRIIWLLPAGGAVIVGLYSLTKLHGKGTATVLDALLHDSPVPPLLAPVIFVSTALTHLLGGSAGREGAALQIGGSLGSACGSVLRLDAADRRITVFCGMAAVFTALFGTPVGAALFVLEVANVGSFCYSALVPCVISSCAAFSITRALGIEPTRFAVEIPAFSLPVLIRTAVLAIACGVLSIAVCFVLHRTERGMERLFPNRLLRVVVGSAAVVLLTILLGSTDYNGAGEPIFRRALEQGICAPEAFLFKLLFTALTLACGLRGGEVVPTFFIGATFGCTVGPLLGLPAGFAAAIGLSATFCGATNCPIATILLSAELFGTGHAELFAVACAISYLFSGYASLYPNQRFLYSKLAAEPWSAEETQK